MHREPADVAKAETAYGQVITLAEDLGMRPLFARAHLGLGRLHLRAANRAKAEEHLMATTTLFPEMDMQFWVEEAGHLRGA